MYYELTIDSDKRSFKKKIIQNPTENDIREAIRILTTDNEAFMILEREESIEGISFIQTRGLDDHSDGVLDIVKKCKINDNLYCDYEIIMPISELFNAFVDFLNGKVQDLSQQDVHYCSGDDGEDGLLQQANKGCAIAQFLYGRSLYEEKHVLSREVLSWYEKAAEGGYAIAQRVLGSYYYNVKNIQEAFKWTKKAAEQGNKQAQYYIGLNYFNGDAFDGEVKIKDKEEAAKWFKLALEGGYWSERMYWYLGEIYADKKLAIYNPKYAFENYEASANLGEQRAVEKLADCYFSGKLVEQDYSKAFSLYNKLFRDFHANNARLFYRLAFCYENGYGVDVSYRNAIWLYGKAGLHGNIKALLIVGKSYEYGELGCKKDEKYALFWYERAAKKSQIAQDALKRINDKLKYE